VFSLTVPVLLQNDVHEFAYVNECQSGVHVCQKSETVDQLFLKALVENAFDQLLLTDLFQTHHFVHELSAIDFQRFYLILFHEKVKFVHENYEFGEVKPEFKL